MQEVVRDGHAYRIPFWTDRSCNVSAWFSWRGMAIWWVKEGRIGRSSSIPDGVSSIYGDDRNEERTRGASTSRAPETKLLRALRFVIEKAWITRDVTTANATKQRTSKYILGMR